MAVYRTLQEDVDMLVENHDLHEILTCLKNAAEEQYRLADEYDRVHCMQDRAPATAARWAMRIMIIERAIKDYERSMR